MHTTTIRSAEERDLDQLAALEQNVWKRRSTPILSRDELRNWLADDSPYFLVAEDDEGICGYYYGRQIRFSVNALDAFLDPKLVTHRGMSDHPHNPHEDAVYGISVAATRSGVGLRLKDAIYELLSTMGVQYFVGFTRLSRLAAYVEKVRKLHGGELPYPLDAIVLWYAHESAKLVSGYRWKKAVPQPAVTLPELRRPDPVLAFHMANTNFGLLSILPDYMIPDPESLNYGALIASVAPHR